MSRIRTVKPEFWTSEQVMECSPLARLAFIGLWNFCDDNGVHPASCKTLKAQIFPADDLTAADVQSLIKELLQQRLIVEFHAENRTWWWVTGWRHQLINRPSKSRFPLPPHDAPTMDATPGTLTESSVNPHGVLMERSLTEGKGVGREEEGKGREEEPAPAPDAPALTATPSAPIVESTPPTTPPTTPSILATPSAPKAKSKPKECARPPSAKTSLPADFAITPELHAWAEQHGYGDLPQHLDRFRDKAQAKGYRYSDWNAAFRNAVRDDWAGLRKPLIATPTPRNGPRYPPPLPTMTPEAAHFEAILRNLNHPVIEGEIAHELH